MFTRGGYTREKGKNAGTTRPGCVFQDKDDQPFAFISEDNSCITRDPPQVVDVAISTNKQLARGP